MKKDEMKVGAYYELRTGNIVKLESLGLGGFGRRQHTTYLIVTPTGRKQLLKSAAQFVEQVQI